MADMETGERISRQKRIELASASGAGVLGLGIGALAGEHLAPYAVVLIALGTILHGWGMLAGHRLEGNARLPMWSTMLYWTCWIALALLAAWLGRFLMGY